MSPPRLDLMQMIRALETRVITGFFCSVGSASFKGHSPAHAQKWNLLYMIYSRMFIVILTTVQYIQGLSKCYVHLKW